MWLSDFSIRVCAVVGGTFSLLISILVCIVIWSIFMDWYV